MERKSKFLALSLLDALEDENFKECISLITKYGANSNEIVIGRGIAPIHYACGMENVEVAEKILKCMLENGGNPNVESEDRMTPMHVAALWGRTNIMKMLLKKGGNINAKDDDFKTPILYAVHEAHFDIIKAIQNYVFEKKIEKKKGAKENIGLDLNFKNIEEKKFTPNKGNYNYDITSPYYINITHRKKNPKENFSNSPQIPSEQQNLFELTESNLSEYSKTLTFSKSRKSIIESWRQKILPRDSVSSINDSLEEINTTLNESNRASVKMDAEISKNDMFIESENIIYQEKSDLDTSYVTARTNFTKNLKSNEYIVQLTEGYVHTDDENGIILYEKHVFPTEKKPKEIPDEVDTSVSNKSANIVMPINYDTDTLRAELTNYGYPPGPITQSTKTLYVKRLVKYKRNLLQTKNFKNSEKENKILKFSFELDRTIKSKDWFQRIQECTHWEEKSISSFQKDLSDGRRDKWREGHLKTSFIYLLIDPRISENLPGQSIYMEKHDVWKKFLASIFYVGKGKSSRPYSHLYDAIKTYSKNSNSIKEDMVKKSNVKLSRETKKISRILDIWKSDKGVICLHLFHNIIPAEAYTKEAAIIDALSLRHLTNLKRGDYYGISKSWNMRTQKLLGIVLLYKAMHIFLAEGESQLLPCDLI